MSAILTEDRSTLDLLAALRAPRFLLELPSDRLTDVLGRARSSNVLGRLAARASFLDESTTPPRLSRILRAVLIQADAFQRSARFEVNRLRRALGPLGDGMILLKGAAYLALRLPVARGRHSGDVDLLFPPKLLAAVESRLLEQGWVHQYTDEYTQSYYRRWMHELPPLRQPQRLAAVDIHHSILPLTSRITPNSEALVRDATDIPGNAGLRALCAADMTIHLALHFAHDGDFDHSLREAIDLDDMLRHFGSRTEFWASLLDRADLHGAQRPLHYAVAVTHALLGTPIPDFVISRLARHALPSTIDRLIRGGMVRCLADTGRISPGLATAVWRQALYIRSHWLRMPPPLLALHLTRQAARRIAGHRSTP